MFRSKSLNIWEEVGSHACTKMECKVKIRAIEGREQNWFLIKKEDNNNFSVKIIDRCPFCGRELEEIE